MVRDAVELTLTQIGPWRLDRLPSGFMEEEMTGSEVQGDTSTEETIQEGFLNAPVSQEDLDAMGWQKELESREGPIDRWSSVTELRKRSDELKDERPQEAAILHLLSAVISMHMVVGTPQPYVAAFQMTNGRSAAPEDVGIYDLDALEMMSKSAKDTWVRARLSDVALQVAQAYERPGWQLGAIAARAHLEYSVSGDDHVVLRRQSLQRAMELGWRYLRNDAEFSEALWKSAKSLMHQGLTESWPGVSIPIAGEIRKRNRSMAGEAAAAFEQQGDTLLVKGPSPEVVDLFREAAALWLAAKDSPREQIAHHKTADALIDLARTPGQAMVQADWMAEGIAVLRRHKGDRARIKELQAELADIRSRIIGEMSTFSHQIDVSSVVTHVRRRISAETLADALLQVAFAFSTWVDAEQVRKEVTDNARRFVFTGMFRQVTYDANGVPVDAASPFDSSDEAEMERRMVNHVSQHDHPILARVAIPAALDVLQSKFEPTLADILGILHSSPVTPRGHEWSLARGILAGLELDWEESAVFLIPQAEPFVRAAFKRAGIHTLSNSTATDGAEEEKSLNELLAHPDVGSVLPPDLILELKALLTHKAGHNLRNRYGHGLIADDELANVGTVALWWTMLRLVLWPFRERVVEMWQQTERVVEEGEA
nr:DUF4209 domain-containing protein [Xanthomonas phaseoli]